MSAKFLGANRSRKPVGEAVAPRCFCAKEQLLSANQRSPRMLRIISAVLVALITIPAYAQGMPGEKMRHAHGQKAEDQKKKPDEKGYSSSLAKMPDRKYDPWQNIR